MKELRIEKILEPVDIDDQAEVTTYKLNHITQVISKKNPTARISDYVNMGKGMYMRKSTGEVFDYNTNKPRNFRKTFSMLYRLINFNFSGLRSEVHITLKYKDGISDYKTVSRDFSNFIKRFRRKYGTGYECIAVFEPHESGNWHIHLLMKTMTQRSFYIHYEDLQAVWKKGTVTIRSLKGSENIGGYFLSTLRPVSADSPSKPDIKGNRLIYYPKGARLYRRSKGIAQPVGIKMKYCEAKSLVGNIAPVKQTAKKIVVKAKDGRDVTVNEYIYEEYLT